MQHAIMTLNNPSGAEIMTGENINHIQVSCTALISCERNKLNIIILMFCACIKRFEIIDKSFLGVMQEMNTDPKSEAALDSPLSHGGHIGYEVLTLRMKSRQCVSNL